MLHDWYISGRSMCYTVCGMAHIKTLTANQNALTTELHLAPNGVTHIFVRRTMLRYKKLRNVLLIDIFLLISVVWIDRTKWNEM